MEQWQSKASVFCVSGSFPQTAYNIQASARMDFPIAEEESGLDEPALFPGCKDVLWGGGPMG
jgi:hypothetical protein